MRVRETEKEVYLLAGTLLHLIQTVHIYSTEAGLLSALSQSRDHSISVHLRSLTAGHLRV